MSEDKLLSRPIVILGAPRSGTTVLGRLLRQHPDLCLIEEPRLTWRFGNDSHSDMLSPHHATPSIRKHIRGQFAQQVGASGATRLLEKTPSNSLRVGFVDRVLDDCIFVHVLRDGVQSTLSIRSLWERRATKAVPRRFLRERLREMRPSQYPYYATEFLRRVRNKMLPRSKTIPLWGPRFPGLEAFVRDLDLLEVCALQWRFCVELACREGRKLPVHRYTEVRLEEFDEAELHGLLDFCGLAPNENVQAAFREMFDTSAPSGRTKDASGDDIRLATELVEPTKAWLATLPPVRRHL